MKSRIITTFAAVGTAIAVTVGFATPASAETNYSLNCNPWVLPHVSDTTHTVSMTATMGNLTGVTYLGALSAANNGSSSSFDANGYFQYSNPAYNPATTTAFLNRHIDAWEFYYWGGDSGLYQNAGAPVARVHFHKTADPDDYIVARIYWDGTKTCSYYWDGDAY